jgi:hypothetical protein
MQTICDDELRFIFIDLKWPGSTADYMAWITSDLCQGIEISSGTPLPKIKKGLMFVGDNAYVKTEYMAVPIKGAKTKVKDSYNFYQSQLRITIEQAFGVLVHCWSILRGPLNIPLFKVVPVVQSLVKLHNFCIDETLHNKSSTLNNSTKTSLQGMTPADATHLNRLVTHSRRLHSVRNSPKKRKKKGKEKTV